MFFACRACAFVKYKVPDKEQRAERGGSRRASGTAAEQRGGEQQQDKEKQQPPYRWTGAALGLEDRSYDEKMWYTRRAEQNGCVRFFPLERCRSLGRPRKQQSGRNTLFFINDEKNKFACIYITSARDAGVAPLPLPLMSHRQLRSSVSAMTLPSLSRPLRRGNGETAEQPTN